MCADPVKPLPIKEKNRSAPKSPLDFIPERQSNELIIAVCGPLGSGHGFVVDHLRRCLSGLSYSVVDVKLSKLIQEKSDTASYDEADGPERYTSLQDAGNELREKHGNQVLAELAIAEIAIQRTTEHPNANVGEFVPDRRAYIIDQLKTPHEVSLLREVYGNLFYLVGVVASENERQAVLHSKGIGKVDATQLMDRDRSEESHHGQKLEKTLQHADYFVRFSNGNTSRLRIPVTRLLNLIHGTNGCTPTAEEHGMYAAYSASLRSACLSRQVGAAILDKEMNLISTGCNDVPKAGGGLYTQMDGENDNRCINREGGKCFNDAEKLKIFSTIQTIINDNIKDNEKAAELVNQIRLRSPIRDLLEFSRSVHAEMDAIVSVARDGNSITRGATLYTTTYPCHNCARHIVAAGISRVFFIEPYEKSKAIDLHNDSIEHDSGNNTSLLANNRASDPHKVQFLHFEGVAPRKYQSFFKADKPRKEDGMAIRIEPARQRNRSVQYLDSYIDLESKVTQHLIEAKLLPEPGEKSRGK